MSKFSFRAALGALLVTAVSFNALDARAGDVPDDVVINASGAREKVVEYGDLNLSSPRGVETLYRRISRAARTVCGVENGRQPVDLAMRARRCKNQAVADAVARIDLPQLNAYHAQLQERSART
jgi:UrcA family protein